MLNTIIDLPPPKKSSQRKWGDDETRIVKIRGRNLHIGDDDRAILIASDNNIIELEADQARNGYGLHSFVSTREHVERYAGQILIHERPHNLIHATDMLTAIRLFEADNGDRIWVPQGDRQEVQIGIERCRREGHCLIVFLRRMRKECILAE